MPRPATTRMRRLATAALLIAALPGQHHHTNFDETKVGAVVVPDLGAADVATWTERRRPELLGLFADHVFGRTPTDYGPVRVRVVAERADALDGLATRKLLHLDLPELPQWEGMDVLLYLPNHARRPVGCFVALNFYGNHAVSPEPDLPLSHRWIDVDTTLVDHHATERSHGSDRQHWPLQDVLEHGFALVTAYYGDVEPDHAEGWHEGLRGHLALRSPATMQGDQAWGAIGAWAFGLSRLADCAAAEPRIDVRRLAVLGHSRLGKAALWAGAQDPRFSIVIANEAGEGGAALMRRDFGQTTAELVEEFPWWFARRYACYAAAPDDCPVDAHELIALVAPRPVYVASAAGDEWGDPKGEFLGAKFAERAWLLHGRRGLGSDVQPPVDTPIGDYVGYHVRSGEHDLLRWDWLQFLTFASRHWR
ncbi:MAG: acetylxylan esterase [Planctomycetes bacterium]|nr:acetylxylan esterase [Planctomycetota bacterium]